jgi:hypothetical protein
MEKKRKEKKKQTDEKKKRFHIFTDSNKFGAWVQ